MAENKTDHMLNIANFLNQILPQQQQQYMSQQHMDHINQTSQQIDINQPSSDIHELDNVLEEADELLSSTRCIEFEKEIFLEEVRKYQCLWNVNTPCYIDRNMKMNAWLQISNVFNREGSYYIF